MNITDEQAKQLIQKLFYYLDVVEETDEGRQFHPNYISSCRALDGAELNSILTSLEQWSNK